MIWELIKNARYGLYQGKDPHIIHGGLDWRMDLYQRFALRNGDWKK